MIAAGTGLAVGGTVDNAALEASLQAVERSGTDRADLALVFVTGDAHARAHEALHAVRRVTGAPVVLGCSGTGIPFGTFFWCEPDISPFNAKLSATAM